ncbi:MAG: ATP-grasp domain-containing protein [Candidatus Ornithomonoglobus sp.]
MKIAILYQTSEPPAEDGIRKPVKKGGYSDSGADIACELLKNRRSVILPVENPSEENDYDWVFPDTEEGIRSAIEKGAEILWLNTVLFEGHPIEKYIGKVKVIGQRTGDVRLYDDKLYTNKLLLRHGLPVTDACAVSSAEEYRGDYPCVIKPIRGRGSQGVRVVKNEDEMKKTTELLLGQKIYGTRLMIEPFLTGEEITVTVLPPDEKHSSPYCLPPVRRFNHIDGIAPYNGIVAVAENSIAVADEAEYSEIMRCCSEAYAILNLKAPIRIDCRENGSGKYMMFDINMKPNMTLASRSHRLNQDSLVMLAAARAGLSRIDLLDIFINSAWN